MNNNEQHQIMWFYFLIKVTADAALGLALVIALMWNFFK